MSMITCQQSQQQQQPSQKMDARKGFHDFVTCDHRKKRMWPVSTTPHTHTSRTSVAVRVDWRGHVHQAQRLGEGV